jgi:hypothetical protein
MNRFFKNNALSIIICFAGFTLLGIRSYGYYTNDQTAFTLIAQAFSQTGKIIAYPEDNSLPYYGNFHPPGLILLLGIFIRLSGIFFGPMLFQLFCLAACLFGLLGVQRISYSNCSPHTAQSRIKNSKDEQHALCALFFLVPFTHQSALLIDIDSSVLIAWGSLFLFLHYWLIKKKCGLLLTGTIMGIVFTLGFWCKFTTPLFVYFSWALWIILVSRHRIKGVVIALIAAATAALSFLATYIPFAVAQGLPVWSCFHLAADRLKGRIFSENGMTRFFGEALRSIFYDMHWFSFLFLPLAILLTLVQLRGFSFTRQWLHSKLPLLAFWTLYIGYTFILPTSQYYMPRYKYGLLPFFVLLLLKPFIVFISKLKKRDRVTLGIAAVFLVFILPDFPTSSAHLRLWYHSFSIAPVSFYYYPEIHMQMMRHLADISETTVWLLPFRAAMFAIYYLSIPVILIFFVHCAIVGLLFWINRSIIRSLWLVILPLWISILIMNMSREYQLFYDAGIQGFKETVEFLRKNIAPGERFLGYRDLTVYTGHQAFCLYRYDDGKRRLDTIRIDSLTQANGIRYCAFPDVDIYKTDTSFHHYLNSHFDTAFAFRDYLVLRHRKI